MKILKYGEKNKDASELKKAGYFSAKLGCMSTWSETHEWCRELVGEDHYTWRGNTFFFENERIRNWFLLRWS